MFAKVKETLNDGYVLYVWAKPHKPQQWIIKCEDKRFRINDYVKYDPKSKTLETSCFAFKNCLYCLLPHPSDIEVC